MNKLLIDVENNAASKNIKLLKHFEEKDLWQFNCSSHGDFECRPKPFLGNTYGCSKCSYDARAKNYYNNQNNKKYNVKTLTDSVKLIDYMSNINFEITRSAVNKKFILNCPIHGHKEYFAPLLIKNGCISCKRAHRNNIKEFEKNNKVDGRAKANALRTLPFEYYKNIAVKKHGAIFTYDTTNYINATSNITIVCKSGHVSKTNMKNHIGLARGCAICSLGNFISINETKWLDSFGLETIERQKLIITSSGKKYTDGYDSITNTIYEFLGDYWHGNLKIYNEDYVNKKIKATAKELFDITEKRLLELKSLGYNIVYKWESDKINRLFIDKLEY